MKASSCGGSPSLDRRRGPARTDQRAGRPRGSSGKYPARRSRWGGRRGRHCPRARRVAGWNRRSTGWSCRWARARPRPRRWATATTADGARRPPRGPPPPTACRGWPSAARLVGPTPPVRAGASWAISVTPLLARAVAGADGPGKGFVGAAGAPCAAFAAGDAGTVTAVAAAAAIAAIDEPAPEA